MTIYVKHNNEVKSAIPYVKHNGEVKIPTSGWAKTGGELKQIWPPVSADGTVYIFNQATLEAFRDRVNAGETSLNARVIADITLTGEWTPIANYVSNSSLIYTGTFDGGGHTITGLTINFSNSYHGLFGYIGTGGTVKNLNLASTSINGSNGGYVGGIVGYNNGGTVQNCTNSATVSGSAFVGGIVGCNDNNGTISGNINTGDVTASGTINIFGYAGGIVGYNKSGTVSGNINTGTVKGEIITSLLSVGVSESPADSEDNSNTFSAIGGIIGYNDGGTVSDNTNSGSVSGGTYTGDIIGYDAPVSAEESAEASSEASAASEADASNDSAADEE